MDRKNKMVPVLVGLALLAMLSTVMVSGQLLAMSDDTPSTRLTVAIPKEQPAMELRGGVVRLDAVAPASEPEATQETKPSNPSASIHDGRQTWDTDTQVDIFRSYYNNKTGDVTVISPYGQKLIAPGTSNQYIFYVENTGDVSLDYTITASGEATFVKDGVSYTVPIQVKLSSRSGKYLAGSRTGWAGIEALNQVNDSGTIASGFYNEYTLQWRWPYEQADTEASDAYDTMLGDLAAAGDEIWVTVGLNVRVSASDNPDAPGGDSPVTGDSANLALWMTLCILSFAGFVILLRWNRKDSAHES